jgi:X-X-X-Leu-X-X-Gly heptad repeat protein
VRPTGRRLAVLALLAALAVPASAGAVTSCAPGPGRVLEHRALIAPDGEPRSLSTWVVGPAGLACRVPGTTTSDDLGVAVAITHRDAGGAAVEGAALARTEGSITTRVRLVDTTAREVVLAAEGPAGPVTESRAIGTPMTVRIDVTYPSTWEPTPPADAVVRRDGRSTVVSGIVVLAAPFTPGEAALEVSALPGRGTPEVSVEVTTLPGPVLQALTDRSDDRETYAVLGALLEVTADGTVELADGAGELADGLDALADGTAELADGTAELADGTAELADGVDELVRGVELLATGTRGLADGAGGLAAGLDQLAPQLEQLATLAGFVEQQVGSLAAVDPAACASLPATPSTLLEQATTLRCGISGVSAAFDDPEQGLVVGAAALADGAGQTADGVDELLAGVRELAEGTRALAEATATLAEGTRELADGAREAADGAGELADGADELPEALLELLGIADRRAAALALDGAAVARAIELADARARGSDGVVTVLSTSEDRAIGVPVVALGAAGGLGLGLALWPLAGRWWRRRRGRVGA